MTRRLIGIAISIVLLVLITVSAKALVHVNATTVALLFLTVVLAVSSFGDSIAGVITAVISGALFNFYFLPPFGTFYIEAPENWVAFSVYTITAIVVGHFSAAVRKRATEADEMQYQLACLSQFSDIVSNVRSKNLTLELLCDELRKSFNLQYCSIYLFGSERKFISSGSRNLDAQAKAAVESQLPKTLLDVVTEDGCSLRYSSLVSRGQTIGVLVTSYMPLSKEILAATAEMVSLIVQQTGSSLATA